jgi:peptide/nickel transport system substrate-binding protein
MYRKQFYIVGVIVLTLSMVLAACGAPATPAPTQPPAVATEAPPPAAAPTEAPAATEAMATEAMATEAPTQPPAAAAGADTIIIGTTDTVASFDPADAYAVRDWEIIRNINDGLLKWKPGTGDELVPDMAADMPVITDDGKTYTFTLKDGIKFGDGSDFNAQIYADSMNRTIKIGPDCPNGVAGALVTPYLDSVEAPDAKTVVFHLKQPVAYFLQLVASATYTVANPGNFPADACTLFPTPPVYGTGPWFVSQFVADQQIVFEPNPYYTGEFKPQVKQIIVRFFSDPQTEALAVQNGEIDVAWRYLGGELIGQLKGVQGLHVGTINGGSIRYLILNHTMKPMDDPNVYKALAYAVDRNDIADTVFGGEVNPIYSMVPPGFLGASEAFDTMYASPDMDKAKASLAASGYTESNPLQLELWYPPEHYGTQTAAWMQVIQKQLEATGAIKVTLQSQEWSTYVTACTGGDSYAGCVLGWFYDYPDASNYLEPFIFNGGQGTNISPSEAGTQYGKPINDKAQKLVDLMAQSDVETDLTKRADLLKQAQEIYADLVVTLPLFLNPEYVVFRDNIHASDQYPSPETLNIGGTIEFNYSTLTKTP